MELIVIIFSYLGYKLYIRVSKCKSLILKPVNNSWRKCSILLFCLPSWNILKYLIYLDPTINIGIPMGNYKKQLITSKSGFKPYKLKVSKHKSSRIKAMLLSFLLKSKEKSQKQSSFMGTTTNNLPLLVGMRD